MIRAMLLLTVLLLPASAVAETRGQAKPVENPMMMSGTAEERAACRPDVRKHCHTINSSEGETYLGCLKLNREKLSKACRGVLEKHGQ